MYGPRKAGFWVNPKSNLAHDYRFLRVGQRYQVILQFSDFDGDVHPVGEEWTFRGYSFLPHDDGLSLFVSLSGSAEWHIRMCDRPDDGAVLAALDKHVALAG